MTREDAKVFLDNIKLEELGRAIGASDFYSRLIGYHVQALNMAIKALEQEPCDDTISRQAVIDSLHNKFSDGFDSDRWWNSMSVLYAINKVPSVKPQPKTGHWIEQEDFNGDTYHDCSKCGESFCLIEGTPTDNLYKYCPNCGAKMIEPQESEE